MLLGAVGPLQELHQGVSAETRATKSAGALSQSVSMHAKVLRSKNERIDHAGEIGGRCSCQVTYHALFETYLPNVFVKFRGIPTRTCHFVRNERSDTQQNCIPLYTVGCERVDELMLSIHPRARFISIGSCILTDVFFNNRESFLQVELAEIALTRNATFFFLFLHRVMLYLLLRSIRSINRMVVRRRVRKSRSSADIRYIGVANRMTRNLSTRLAEGKLSVQRYINTNTSKLLEITCVSVINYLLDVYRGLCCSASVIIGILSSFVLFSFPNRSSIVFIPLHSGSLTLSFASPRRN